jgi:uncharacterized protein
MSAETTRKIVLGLFEDLNAGRKDAFLAALADSATWWLPGTWPLAGTMTKAQFSELLTNLGAHTNVEGAVRMTITGVTVEGERAAIEAESYAKMKNGKIYQNKYHFLFIVRDGKIQVAKEYLDTMLANEYLCG